MARSKDDPDRLKKNRDSRRELIASIGDAEPEDFDELSEVTRPDIQIHVHAPAGEGGRQQAAGGEGGRGPAASQETPSKMPAALRAPLIALEGLPLKHRLWGFLALVAALLVAYLASKGFFQ